MTGNIKTGKAEDREYTQIHYYKDSEIPQFVIPYKYGVRDGNVMEYYPNGQVKRICPYWGNVKHGEEKNYFEDGKIESIIRWDCSSSRGEAVFYRRNGHIKETCSYKFNKKHGESVTRYPNGRKKEMCNYENGEKRGLVRTWDEKTGRENDPVYINTYGNSITKSQMQEDMAIMFTARSTNEKPAFVHKNPTIPRFEY